MWSNGMPVWEVEEALRMGWLEGMVAIVTGGALVADVGLARTPLERPTVGEHAESRCPPSLGRRGR